jgi:hypothetical protein
MAAPALIKGDLFPVTWQPALAPSNDEDFRRWVTKEMTRLQAVIANLNDMVPQVATKAPASPKAGMIRLAKGGWNPTGAGGYNPAIGILVRYVGGAWVAFA